MGFEDPFTGYSVLLRALVYVVVPAFLVWQYLRARRALHVFQLEGYKRARFLEWCREHPARARFLRNATEKKPLAMTGRAWRILITTVVLCALGVYVPSGIAHLAGGFPWDVLTCAVTIGLLFAGLPRVLVAADVVMSPVQKTINAGYLRAARSKLDEVAPLVVGVTGSFGKTSTKFAIAGLLGEEGEVLATPGSFNTPLGVCRTINERLAPEHKAFVVEMGAYGEGEIAELVAFARPSIGVLTAIGPAHLERFGSMEAIERGKYEIVRDLTSDGIAIMNVDDERVRRLADATTHVRVVRYGIDAAGAPDVTVSRVETSRRGTALDLVVDGQTVTAETKLLGRHAVGHILAGVAVATTTGVPLDVLPRRIARLAPVEHRLQIIEGAGGVTVIDDAYNSNPQGAAAALEVLSQMDARKRVVVTPGIVELGPLQEQENERFGARAAEVADVVIVVAKLNRDALERGARSTSSAEVITVDSLDEATAALSSVLGPGDVVLFENDLPDQYEG
jgi:UDP-N-acetylmuramoyl-tripeptide--D-alanyl-D-alanine ligase